MTDRFVVTVRKERRMSITQITDRERCEYISNEIQAVKMLNSLDNENKSLKKSIGILEALTGQSLDEMIEFHSIMK